MRLKDKIALITGGARGIGRACVELFYKEGARVIITDIRDDDGEVVAKNLGEKALYHRLDVSKKEDWELISQLVADKFGKIDILINNAGITASVTRPGEPNDVCFCTQDGWDEVFGVNATGTMLGCQAAIKLMKDGGSIINISSRSGIVGVPTAAAYAASKAAIRNHTKSVALYCAQQNYNIRCNSIHPAAIMTAMWDDMLGSGEVRARSIKQIEAGIPLAKFGEPIDVAYRALYLASDESKYVTGIEAIDGGILAGSVSA